MGKLPRWVIDYAVPMMGAFLILWFGWLVWIHGVAEPICPWTEKNQGLLTLVALAAAVFAILYQRHLTQTETARRAREHVAVVLELADSFLADIRVLTDAGVVTAPGLSTWNNARISKRKTLDLLRQSSPADSTLILLLGELDQAFENPFHNPLGPGLQIPEGGALPKLGEMADKLQAARDNIAARG